MATGARDPPARKPGFSVGFSQSRMHPYSVRLLSYQFPPKQHRLFNTGARNALLPTTVLKWLVAEELPFRGLNKRK